MVADGDSACGSGSNEERRGKLPVQVNPGPKPLQEAAGQVHHGIIEKRSCPSSADGNDV